MIDIVIVGDANDSITVACIKSLSNFTNQGMYITSIIFDGYNRSLNKGAKKGNSELIAFCNNDLEFKNGWLNPIIEALKSDKIVSASPWCPKTHRQWWANQVPKENIIGTQTGKIVAGWCLVLKRDWWEEMGGFDERLEFFCCDNSYTMQLEAANKKHALVVASQVLHHQSLTLNKFKGTPKYEELTMGQVRKFNKLYEQNLFNKGQ